MTVISKKDSSGCVNCPLRHRKLIQPRYLRYGSTVDAPGGSPLLAIVGEGPGRTELRQGTVFVGPSGKLLMHILEELGVPVVWLTNASLCYSPGGKDKETTSHYCRPKLISSIKSVGPSAVVALGAIATRALLPGIEGGITKTRGRFVHSPELGLNVLPTFHPAAVLRNPEWFTDLVNDLSKAVSLNFGPEKKALTVKVASTVEEVEEFLKGYTEVVIDLETSGLDPLTDRILCGVVATEDRVCIIPGEMFKDPDLGDLLERDDIEWIGHNSKFDRSFLKAGGVADIRFSHDTMLAHYILDERGGIHGLKSICAEVFNAPDWEKPVRSFLRHGRTSSYDRVPEDVLYKYAALDGIWTFKLFIHLQEELRDKPNERRILNDFLIPSSHALVNMELAGIKIDLDRMSELSEQFEAELKVLARKAVEMTRDYRFNPNSPQQVAHYLFDVCHLPRLDGRSTKFDVLKALEGQNPLPELVLRYRKLTKLLGTYIEGWKAEVSPYDSRIHACINLHRAVTGRTSCSRPNLQALDHGLDGLVIADTGNLLVAGDFSQAELRLLALQSKDPWLLDVYQRGGDLHTERAIQLFGSDFTKQERVFCKNIHFGLVYGRGVKSLVEDAHLPSMTTSECEEMVEDFFANMPRVLEWSEEIKRAAREQGYVESLTGRKRRFPLITWSNAADVDRQSVNFMCQSPVSDVILMALVQLDEEFLNDPDVNLILTIHDSLIAEAPAHKAAEVGHRIREVMEAAAAELFGPLVPLVVDIGIGESKASLKPLEDL